MTEQWKGTTIRVPGCAPMDVSKIDIPRFVELVKANRGVSRGVAISLARLDYFIETGIHVPDLELE